MARSYCYIKNGDLSSDDLEWYSKMNSGAEPTGAIFKTILGPGIENVYVVFKRGTGKLEFSGAVTDWDDKHVVYQTSSKYMLINKCDGKVIDNNFKL